MNSAASRIIKARQYAQERDRRVKVHNFEVELHGDNGTHLVSYQSGEWYCRNCEEFQLRGVCSHVMAMEEILGETVEPAMMALPMAA
jgi:hypothetical protein